MRGLVTLPPRWIPEPSVVRDRMEDPQKDPLVVYCFCVCSGNALLRDLGVSRSREHDLSVLSIYPRFIVYCRVLFCYMLMSVDCFGLIVSTCPLSDWPYLFCGAGHEKRRGEQLKWSLAFSLYIGSFPCALLGPVHTARLDRVCF